MRFSSFIICHCLVFAEKCFITPRVVCLEAERKVERSGVRVMSYPKKKIEAKADWLRCDNFHWKINKNKWKFIYNLICGESFCVTQLTLTASIPNRLRTELCQQFSIHYCGTTKHTHIAWVIITRRLCCCCCCFVFRMWASCGTLLDTICDAFVAFAMNCILVKFAWTIEFLTIKRTSTMMINETKFHFNCISLDKKC